MHTQGHDFATKYLRCRGIKVHQFRFGNILPYHHLSLFLFLPAIQEWRCHFRFHDKTCYAKYAYCKMTRSLENINFALRLLLIDTDAGQATIGRSRHIRENVTHFNNTSILDFSDISQWYQPCALTWMELPHWYWILAELLAGCTSGTRTWATFHERDLASFTADLCGIPMPVTGSLSTKPSQTRISPEN